MNPNWQNVHDDFPIHRKAIWLNNCGITPAGRHITKRMHAYLEALADEGPGGGGETPARLAASIKASLGELLCAQSEELAIVHNTAEAMNLVSLGMSLSPGDEILLLENEYPSNVYPWLAWQSRGVRIRFIPVGRSPEEFLHSFRSLLNDKTRVVALSAVHWCTGMPIALTEVAQICHGRGIRLVIDGSQGVGQRPLDMKALGPCIVGFSAWKWLLGPLGLGVLAISKELLPTLKPVFKGPDAMAKADYLPYQTEVRSSADRYTYSTANYNDWVYFDASLSYLKDLGFTEVQARISALAEHLWGTLGHLGFQSAYDRSSAPESGILSVARTDVDSTKLATALNERGIVVRERMGYLRMAPHVYISEAELDRAVDAIRDIVD